MIEEVYSAKDVVVSFGGVEIIGCESISVHGGRSAYSREHHEKSLLNFGMETGFEDYVDMLAIWTSLILDEEENNV